MLPRNLPDHIHVAFDDHRLVDNAGLILPATLAQHLGLPQLVDRRLDLGRPPGRANTGAKIMTLVASALAGGDCIDDADALRAGALGCVVKAPSTLGTFLRSFRWGHVRQLDRVSRELLARAWTTGAGTGEVLMSRLREGRANTARGAAHFLRETVSRVRYGGASGQLTMRADSGFYTHAVVSACRETNVRFSITIRQHKSLRNLSEAIPETDWTPIPYWMDAAAVAETTYTTFQTEPVAAPVRLIVRRVQPTPGFPPGPLPQLQLSRLHHRPGRGNPGAGGRPPPPRRDRERHSRHQVQHGVESSPLGPLRRQRRLAGHPGAGA